MNYQVCIKSDAQDKHYNKNTELLVHVKYSVLVVEKISYQKINL